MEKFNLPIRHDPRSSKIVAMMQAFLNEMTLAPTLVPNAKRRHRV